ncbi:MAG: hypothetical protein CML66_09275 [Rhodobacteraceae bacterium]|nr:hypothetical protein [Paracoccaceae bacterium]MAY46769.1 hypothetical protein [Paracoccaceae bacterium]
MTTINVNSVSDHSGTSGDDLFVINAISSGYPTATLNGGGGTDTLDASNVFVGYSTMYFQDTEVNGVAGFSFGDYEATSFEVIYGSATSNNWFLVQYVDYAVTLHGGSGDDWFAASFGPTGSRTADTFYGYGGNDEFDVRPLDKAYGGSGNDTFDLYATSEDVTGSIADGGSGIDTLDLSFGWTVDLRDEYADSVFAGSDDRYTVLNIENVTVYAWRSYETQVWGTSGANVFSVNSDFDDGSVGVYFDGRGGNDTLTGSAGADTLIGGNGNDLIDGRKGIDDAFGGEGDDTILVNSLNDIADGGAGTDTLDASGVRQDLFLNMPSATSNFTGFEIVLGGSGDDKIRGTNGSVTIDGGAGNDNLRGRPGDDILRGGTGDDAIRGDGGSDTIDGGDGDDELFGNNGADTIIGGAGSDRIEGGTGQDTLTGGADADRFVFAGAWQRDTITDFEQGLDRIVLRDLRDVNGGDAVGFDQLLVQQVGALVRIGLDLDRDGVEDKLDLGGTGDLSYARIDILNSTVADFSGADFIF